MAGAVVFLSEDLQDGIVLDGRRAINLFALSDRELAKLLGT